MENYTDAVKRNDGEMKALAADAANLQRQYVEAGARFLDNWFQQEAKSIATHQHQITMQLKPDQLTALKGEVKSLVQRAAEFAQELAICDYWQNGEYGSLNDALRIATANIVPVLTKYGYSVNSEIKNGRVQMAGGLGEDTAMGELRRKHSSVLQKMHMCRQERTRIEQQHQRNEASKLWDSA